MPTFKAAFLPDSLVLSTTLSDDHKTASIIVDNLLVALPTRDKPPPPAHLSVGLVDNQLVAYRVGNIFVRLDGDEPTVTVRVDIKGGVDTQAGARAVLVTRLAGHTFADELADGEKSGDYSLTHSVSVSPATGVPVTFFLLIDRCVVDGALPHASASVETVDFNFESPASP